ncbi:hypothetical protein K6H09_004713 [Candida tropicalis]
MDKYSDLPDIDQAGQEVFESSDVESELELPREVPAIEDVDESNIDIQSSKDKFARSEILDSVTYDFSGNVSRLNGYHLNQVDETVEEKLSRISRELEEIKISDKSPTTTKQVYHFQELLNSLKKQQLHDSGNHIHPDYISIDSVFEKIVPSQESASVISTENIQSLASLEERLNTIELSIGTENPSKPLNLAIRDLDRKISIIENPEYNFETIQSEINKLDKELETLEMKCKVLNLDEDILEKDTLPSAVSNLVKIDEIYERLPIINQYNSLAPKLLSRLKTLSKIHHDLEGSVELSGSIDQVLKDIELDMRNWDQTLNKLNENLVNYEKNFDANSSSINERVNDLILKVESLSTD